MAEDTDWNSLKQRCVDNKTTLTLRTETINGQYRFSLSAIDRDGKILWDNRANDEGYAPQTVITGLVSGALERWWA